MHKKILILFFMLVLLLCFASVQKIPAEIATQSEMELVCQNWLTYMVYQTGTWAGEINPQILKVDEIIEGDTLLALCFSIAPRGFVVVPALKELPPVKAYSEEFDLDVEQEDGFPQLLREVLLSRMRLYARTYGSLDAVQPPTGDVLLGRGHKAEWSRLANTQQEFENDLIRGKLIPLAQVGPLLTTSWHQGSPYNNFCPMGDGGRTAVGCVATATAQIMKYWNWPPTGTGSHSYVWDGDDSCDSTVGGGTLSADFSDTYDWENMPDSCDLGCTSQQQDALAELSYEVGVAYEMDYGVCGSGTATYKALQVFPTYFGYDSSINRQNRDTLTQGQWFSLIQTEINNGRPIQYRIRSHSIVCDGWRDTGGQNQYHMNYGWGGSFTTWFTLDSLYCYWVEGDTCPIAEEYMIRNIECANRSPDLFSLLSPEDNDIVLSVLTFDWEDAKDPDVRDTVRYDLYISTSSDFHPDSTIIHDNLINSDYSDSLDLGIFYWKIKAYDNRGAETWSNQVWSFHVNSPPGNFSLISPADLDSVKTPFLLDWEISIDSDPVDTVFYDVYVNRSMVFDSASWEHIYPTSDIPAESLDIGLWYWAVKSYDNWGTERWSDDTLSFYVYLCGDCNTDGEIAVADVIYFINFLFKGGFIPKPLIASDVNCDGEENVSDVIYLINYLFKGGPLPCDPTDNGVPDC